MTVACSWVLQATVLLLPNQLLPVFAHPPMQLPHTRASLNSFASLFFRFLSLVPSAFLVLLLCFYFITVSSTRFFL